VPQWEILEESEDMEGSFSEKFHTDGEDAGNGEMEMDETNLVAPRLVSSEKHTESQRSSKRVKFSDDEATAENHVVDGFVPLPAQPNRSTSPKNSRTSPSRDTSPTRTSPRKHVDSYAHTGDPWRPSGGVNVRDFGLPGNDTPMVDVPPNPPAHPLNPQKEPDDERSGGWIPIKNFPQYRTPVDPGLDDDEPEQIAYENLIWDDIVENSVWRPRRVGEKTLKIDFDDDDPEEFYKHSELNVDGGVDCGREPYPACITSPIKEHEC
jgi:hypothetical protein